MGTVSVEYAAKTKTRNKGLIVAMFVRESFRGQGLARKLMRAAVQHGVERQGLRVMQLEVTQGNTAAQRLYQSLGFEPFGVEPMAVWTPDGYRSKVHMWLDLSLVKKNLKGCASMTSGVRFQLAAWAPVKLGWVATISAAHK